jgi:hypothetical protein
VAGRARQRRAERGDEQADNEQRSYAHGLGPSGPKGSG